MGTKQSYPRCLTMVASYLPDVGWYGPSVSFQVARFFTLVALLSAWLQPATNPDKQKKNRRPAARLPFVRIPFGRSNSSFGNTPSIFCDIRFGVPGNHGFFALNICYLWQLKGQPQMGMGWTMTPRIASQGKKQPNHRRRKAGGWNPMINWYPKTHRNLYNIIHLDGLKVSQVGHAITLCS